jgi:hypothetical protein
MSDQNPSKPIHKLELAKVIWRFVAGHQEGLLVILAFVATLAAIAGTFAAFWAVKTQNKVSRELATQQNFLLFYEQWESDGMQERRARFASELLENPTPENVDDSPLVFLETLSNAAKRGLLDRELVWTTFYIDVTSYWAAAQPYIQQNRLREQCSCIFEELEALSKQLVAQAGTRGQNQSLIGTNKESVRRFLELERRRQSPEKPLHESK